MSSTMIRGRLLYSMAFALVTATGPLAAQPIPSPAAVKAVAEMRQLYRRGAYAASVAVGDSVLRRGLGSTDVQSWRLASLARLPGRAPAAMRAARKMANMHPESPWAAWALAAAAVEISDSVHAADAPSARALASVPGDPVVLYTRARVLRLTGRAGVARALLDQAPAAIAADPLLTEERARLRKGAR